MIKSDLINKLEQIFQGDPWHGASTLKLLSAIASENYLVAVPPGNKTIAHLLEHILAWKQLAIEKIKRNETFDIEINSIEDWPNPEPKGDPKQYYVNKMQQVHQELVSALEAMDEAWFDEKTINKTYDNRYLIQGIVEHDLYHSGQIGIFNSLLLAQKSSS